MQRNLTCRTYKLLKKTRRELQRVRLQFAAYRREALTAVQGLDIYLYALSLLLYFDDKDLVEYANLLLDDIEQGPLFARAIKKSTTVAKSKNEVKESSSLQRRVKSE